MANPNTVALPAIDLQQGTMFVVRKGTKVLGQLTSFKPQSQTQARKLARIGDTSKYTVNSPVESSVQIEMYSDLDAEEVAALLGVTKPTTGGWLGTEQIRLNPTVAKFDLFVDCYSGATGTTGDVLRGSHKLIGFRANSASFSLTAENEATWSIGGDMDDYYYQPAAGAGA